MEKFSKTYKFLVAQGAGLMKEYLVALQHILEYGNDRPDRTSVGTKSVFGYQMRFNLQKGFPAVTTKKLAWKAVVSELLWFLEGSTDERRLAEIYYGRSREDIVGKKTIWTANADYQGKNLGYTNTDLEKELGPVYGSQWRSWQARGHTVDQVVSLLKSLYFDPFSRRHILSAWNVGEIDRMSLPPCHLLAQFYVSNKSLSCQVYQRSVDAALGLPFNIASYSLLVHMLAQMLDLSPGELVHTSGDLHIYNNHIDGIKEQLLREPHSLPTLSMPSFTNLHELLLTRPDDYKLEGYNHWPAIDLPMAV